MDLEAVKRLLETGEDDHFNSIVGSLPQNFIEPLVLKGIKLDRIEPGRLVCSFTVSTRLLNSGNSLHGGVTANLVDFLGWVAVYTAGCAGSRRISVEINVSYMDAAYVGDEIEIDAKTLRVGKATAVVSVEFKKKKTVKIFALGRQTIFLLQSKL